MTYYIGLKLKDKTLIAADTRVSMYENGTMQTKDGYTKINKISQYAYVSAAGNMNACIQLCRYLRENNIKYPEDILQIDIEKRTKQIYNEQIQEARQEIHNFEEEKETHGYLNLSIIVAGINKENKPIMFFMNNLNGFAPKLVASGTATNMGSEVNQFTSDFFRKFNKDSIRLSKNPEAVINLLRHLFWGISNKDNSVSPTFDVIIVDSNGVDTLNRY